MADDHDDLERRVADLFPPREESGSRTRKGWHSTETVQLVAKLIDNSGVMEKLAAWRIADDPDFGTRGGRPAMFYDRHVLTLLLLHSIIGEPLLITELATTARERLNPQSRELLGLPAGLVGETGHQVYTNLRRALKRMLAVIDSAPYSSGRRLTFKQVQEIRLMRADISDELAEKARRTSWLTNQLLHMTYLALPQEIRDRWKGTIAVDGTAVPVWGKLGSPRFSENNHDATCSPEFDAGWHVRGSEDHADDKRFKRTKDEFKWAYESTITVMSDDPDTTGPFPKLALSMSLEKPAGRVAENAMACVGEIVDRGLPINYFVGDRAYLPNAKVENLQGPLLSLGYKLISDYRKDQLGIQGQHAGAIMVEGTWYCPSMPTALVEASIDHSNGKISTETYQRLIDARRDYMLQTKQKADANGVVQMRCPASGPIPTADCPLKPRAGAKTGLGMPKLRTRVTAPPKQPDKICSNRSSTAFGPETGLKYGQTVPYRSKEWHQLYHTPRNTIEGLNAMAKDEGKGALASAGRRRARGYTLQFVYTAVLLAGANIRAIDSFLSKKTVVTEKVIDRTDRRRRKRTLADYRQRANAPPLVGPAAEAAKM